MHEVSIHLKYWLILGAFKDGPSMHLWYIKCEMFLCYKHKVKLIEVTDIVVVVLVIGYFYVYC
jgi:hypothetical protein